MFELEIIEFLDGRLCCLRSVDWHALELFSDAGEGVLDSPDSSEGVDLESSEYGCARLKTSGLTAIRFGVAANHRLSGGISGSP
jgi:hypothetical protein